MKTFIQQQQSVNMGQYFNFINKSKGDAESEIMIPINFGLAWAKGMEHFDDALKRALFMYVVVGNRWSYTDDIEARGDEDDLFRSLDYVHDVTMDERKLTENQLYDMVFDMY
jgi:hypothetical protein